MRGGSGSNRFRLTAWLGAVAHLWIVGGYAEEKGALAASRHHSPAAIVGRTWQWESLVTPLEQIRVPAPERYLLELAPDGKARGCFDCNRGGGTYRIAEGMLELGPFAVTRMACSSGSLGARYGIELGLVRTFFVENGYLYLEQAGDGGTLRFRPAD